MPVKPAQPPTKRRNKLGTAGAQVRMPPSVTTSATEQEPQVSPRSSTVLQPIGLDAAQFSFALGTGPPTLTFPNLPRRDNTANPLTGDAELTPPLVVSAKDHLLFTVALQNLVAPAGVVVGVHAFAVDRNAVRVPGPFLGSNVFASFLAVLTVTAPSGATGVISGFAVGSLFLSVG